MLHLETIPTPVQCEVNKGVRPVRALREWRGLTQDALADRSCTAVSQIQRAERGGDIPPDAMRLIAAALGVPEKLLGH